MKKLLTISALTLLGAGSMFASNSDIYITGSTAFRANCFDACSKLFDGGVPTDSNNGTGSAPVNSDTRWTMIGTMNTLFGTGANTITIHGNFNGSVQGCHAMANKDLLVFLKNATRGDVTLATNTASCAFSDADSSATIAPCASSLFTEKHVCVLPFVYTKSAVATGVANVTNITVQQTYDLLGNGQAPLSFFTGNAADASTTVYNVVRSLDSGTRVMGTSEPHFVGTPAIYYFDETGAGGYSVATTNIGPAFYGPGYVGGGDVKRVLNYTFGNNQAVAILGLADAKGVGSPNYTKILSYNGVFPIKGEISGATPATNDFAPIITGKYSLWSFEVLIWPKVGQFGTYTDQNITFTLLNNVLTRLSSTTGLPGSIDDEILISQATGATAVRISDMLVDRTTVGGPIAP
jgi:hypothetical protein